MLRVVRATAARSSRTSFSFSSTRKLSTEAVQASSARSCDALPLQTASFFFLRKFSTSRSHGSASDLPNSSKEAAQGAAADNFSCSAMSKAHREGLVSPELACDSKNETLRHGSRNTGAEEAGLEGKSEVELDEEDLDYHENVSCLTVDSESLTPSSEQETELLSASVSVYEEEEVEEGNSNAGGNSYSDSVVESDEDATVDLSKVPEELKEMMDDSYVCESAEEDFLSEGPLELLTLDEVNQVLEEVRARDVKIFSVQDRCEWTDVMVIATGISDRHVRGIADALVYKIKKKGNVDSPLYPTIEGQLGGKWLVVDCGNIVIHVLNEESRAYYRLEELWTGDVKHSTTDEDFETMLNRAGIKDAVP